MKKKNKISKWPFIVIVIIGLTFLALIFSGIVSLFTGNATDLSGNVAVIPIKGLIVSEGDTDVFGLNLVSSTDTLELIRKAEKNPAIKAVVFEINSGGGNPVPSYEIVEAIKKLNKTKIAWVRDVAASGAYWIASSCDTIVANPLSITGSVGVIGSYLEFGGFLDRYNITYQRLVAGRNKDIGSPFKELSESEETLMQNLLNDMHDIFLSDVAKNRGLNREQKLRISDAMIYLGKESVELGLVDELGSKDKVIEILEKELDAEANLVEYSVKRSFFDALSGVFHENSFFVGKGLGRSMFDEAKYDKGLDILI